MDLQLCYNASEDTFPLPLHIKQIYGPGGFPTRCDTHRPYISSNFVMGLDGKASFTDLKGRAGGKEVSRSKEDRRLMTVDKTFICSGRLAKPMIPERRALAFRWALPIVQLALCAIALWPVRSARIQQIKDSIRAYESVKTRPPEPPKDQQLGIVNP